MYISLYILLHLLRLYIKIQNLHHLNFSLFTAKGRRQRRRQRRRGRRLRRANQSPDVANAKLLSREDAASHEGVGGASPLLCMDMQDTDFGMFRLSLSLAGELRLNSVSCGVGNSNEGDAGAGAVAEAGSTLPAAAAAAAAEAA